LISRIQLLLVEMSILVHCLFSNTFSDIKNDNLY